jgi:chaperonin GroES
MNVIPLDDRILVRPSETITEHGRRNVTDDATGERQMRGMVIAAGMGAPNGEGQSVPLAVQAGDTVLFGRHLGCEVTFGGSQYWMIKADDIVKIEVRAITVDLYGARRSPDASHLARR